MTEEKESAVRVPKQARSAETRAKLLEAGQRLFVARGYHETSSKRIAREAGVSIGSFYNYFPDKKALLLELHREHAKQVHDSILAILEPSGPPEGEIDARQVVEKLIDAAFAAHTLSPALHRVIESMRYTDEDFARLDREAREYETSRLVSLFEMQQDSLRVDDFEAAASVISGAVEDAIHRRLLFGGRISEDRLKRALVDMLIRYLYT